MTAGARNRSFGSNLRALPNRGSGAAATPGRCNMAVVVEPKTGAKPVSDGPADVFVAFGITGDLAKVMTFRSLYRLERRGLLKCPVLGVAVGDWTVEHLREHARACI